MSNCMITRKGGIKPEMITASISRGGSVSVVNGGTYSCMVIVPYSYDYVSNPNASFSGGDVSNLKSEAKRLTTDTTCSAYMYTFDFKATSSNLVVNVASSKTSTVYVSITRIS